jgi:hypothetical protein
LYQTHKIFAFHPTIADLHDLEVTSPWKGASLIYPGPYEDLLKAHFQTSIFSSVAAVEPLEDNDNNDDDNDGNDGDDDWELVEITPIHIEAIRI